MLSAISIIVLPETVLPPEELSSLCDAAAFLAEELGKPTIHPTTYMGVAMISAMILATAGLEPGTLAPMVALIPGLFRLLASVFNSGYVFILIITLDLHRLDLPDLDTIDVTIMFFAADFHKNGVAWWVVVVISTAVFCMHICEA